jgi:hypothetical protein
MMFAALQSSGREFEDKDLMRDWESDSMMRGTGGRDSARKTPSLIAIASVTKGERVGKKPAKPATSVPLSSLTKAATPQLKVDECKEASVFILREELGGETQCKGGGATCGDLERMDRIW